MKRTVFIAVLFLAAALALPRPLAARVYPLPGRGALALPAPPEWKESVSQPPDKLPPTIAFEPASGPSFKVLVTAGWSAAPGAAPADDGELRRQVEAAAARAAGQAVEMTLAVKELRGPECRGFYFSATDRAPKPGEFACLTQGIARSGGILLVFTVLTNKGQEAIVLSALDMVAGAVFQPEKAGQ